MLVTKTTRTTKFFFKFELMWNVFGEEGDGGTEGNQIMTYQSNKVVRSQMKLFG